jgi:hypothetical protein
MGHPLFVGLQTGRNVASGKSHTDAYIASDWPALTALREQRGNDFALQVRDPNAHVPLSPCCSSAKVGIRLLPRTFLFYLHCLGGV